MPRRPAPRGLVQPGRDPAVPVPAASGRGAGLHRPRPAASGAPGAVLRPQGFAECLTSTGIRSIMNY